MTERKERYGKQRVRSINKGSVQVNLLILEDPDEKSKTANFISTRLCGTWQSTVSCAYTIIKVQCNDLLLARRKPGWQALEWKQAQLQARNSPLKRSAQCCTEPAGWEARGSLHGPALLPVISSTRMSDSPAGHAHWHRFVCATLAACQLDGWARPSPAQSETLAHPQGCFCWAEDNCALQSPTKLPPSPAEQTERTCFPIFS